jgi:hypothetical protein
LQQSVYPADYLQTLQREESLTHGAATPADPAPSASSRTHAHHKAYPTAADILENPYAALLAASSNSTNDSPASGGSGAPTTPSDTVDLVA